MSKKFSRLGLVIAVLLIAFLVAPVIDYMTRPDYEREALRTRERLQSIETLQSFTATLQKAGMQCQAIAEGEKTIGFCRRTNGLPKWSWAAWLEIFPNGVVARGEFNEGRKVSEYQVGAQTMGL